MRRLLPATIGLVCLLLACGAAYSQSADTTKLIQTKVHIVQKGQLSIDIAKKYGLDLDKLKHLNPGRNLAKLQIGDKIVVGVVPVQSPKPEAANIPKTASTAKNAPLRQDKIVLMHEHEKNGNDQQKAGAVTFGTVILTIFKLLVVLALAYFTILALKLLSNKRDASPATRRNMKVIDTVKLNNASNLHLVEVGGKRLLIGSSSGQVNLLAEIEEEKAEEPAPVESSKFAEYLAKYSGQKFSNTPAGRVAGLLRDCASYLQDRKRGLSKSSDRKPGDSDEA
ncbi:MAG: flagellar biosynthetic protein FliO [Armatimonadota bacterium]